MMKTRALVAAILAVLATPAMGQVASTAIADIESPDLERRMRAFQAINSRSEFASRRGELLLRLLVREDSAIAKAVVAGGGIGEGWGEYHAELVDACLSKCDRQGFLDHQLSLARPGARSQARAIELLAVIRGKRFSRAQVASMDSAFIMATAPPHNFMVRSAGVAGISRALNDSVAVPATTRKRMLDALHFATFDSVSHVRIVAVQALAKAASAKNRERGGPPIVFHPDVDSLAEAAAAYDSLWRADGARITRALEGASGLRFAALGDRRFAALVSAQDHYYRGWFDRIILPASRPSGEKRALLIHELGRQLLGRLYHFDEDDHPALHLWLQLTWAEAYGSEFARAQEAAERQRSPGEWTTHAARPDRMRHWTELRDARIKKQLKPPPPCPAWPVDTTGWRRTTGVDVGVELRHPPHYIRKIWERVSDTTKRYLEVHRNGRVTDASVSIASSDEYPVKLRTTNSFRDRRCTMPTHSGEVIAWFGRRPLGRCTGCPPPEPAYAVEMFLKHRRTGRLIHLDGHAPDSLTFREVMAMARTVRLLDLP